MKKFRSDEALTPYMTTPREHTNNKQITNHRFIWTPPFSFTIRRSVGRYVLLFAEMKVENNFTELSNVTLELNNTSAIQ